MVDAVPHSLALRFPLGLPQWNTQLPATSCNLMKNARLPACPDGSTDLMARERELNENRGDTAQWAFSVFRLLSRLR